MKILAGILCAVAAHAITIIGPSGIGNTEARIDIPSSIMDTVGAGGMYADADTDLYDQTFTYTVTGGTGTGYMFFSVTGFAMPFDFTSPPEGMSSFALVLSPFQLFTPPGDFKQGAVPFYCIGVTVPDAPCSLQFEFGVPKTVRWRMRSTVGYIYERRRLTDLARLRGHTILASTTVDLWAVASYSEATGMTLLPDAVVTIAPVPEPGGLAAAGAGATALAARWLIRERQPARGRR